MEYVEGIGELDEEELAEGFAFDVQVAFTEDSALVLNFIYV